MVPPLQGLSLGTGPCHIERCWLSTVSDKIRRATRSGNVHASLQRTRRRGKHQIRRGWLTTIPSSELTGATLKDPAAAVLQNYAYRYNPSGNGVLHADQSTSHAAQYGVLNELKQFGGAGTTFLEGTINEKASVTINGAGADVTPLPGGTAWKYEKEIPVSEGENTVQVEARDASGNARTSQFKFVVGPVESSYTYDANGNLLTDGFRVFTWDSMSRVTSVAAGGDTYSWTYDGNSRRRTESKNGVLQKQWLLAGLRIIQERNATGAVVKNYYPEGEFVPTQGGQPAQKIFYTRDHLGSIRELVGENGAILARYDYDPYGKITKRTDDPDPTFAYTGHYYHSASGLLLAPYRAYDSKLGRWLSRDPYGNLEDARLVGGELVRLFAGNIRNGFHSLADAELLPEGPNLYVYARNAPMDHVDWLGLECTFLGLDRNSWQSMKADYERNLRWSVAGIFGTQQASVWAAPSPLYAIMETAYAGLGIGSGLGVIASTLVLGFALNDCP
jgi:RHS repeat-associated protein